MTLWGKMSLAVYVMTDSSLSYIDFRIEFKAVNAETCDILKISWNLCCLLVGELEIFL
jgi:hypothetical protein